MELIRALNLLYADATVKIDIQIHLVPQILIYMKLTQLPAWKALSSHFQSFHDMQIQDLFANDLERFSKLSLKTDDLFLDYSKNRISSETMELLVKLAEESDIDLFKQSMFDGEKINFTEQRAVMHTALRNQTDRPIMVDNENIMPAVKKVMKQVELFSEDVRNEKWLGFSGKPIKNIINIGIGGSHLGPVLVSDALSQYGQKDLTSWYVSCSDIEPVLRLLDPETSLFIIVSKSFTTKETIANAEIAKTWLIETAGDQTAVSKHFVAVSANSEMATSFGIDKENIFQFWDWVGGRYSLWSAVGLSTVLLIGMKNFKALLAGACRMDEHFRTAPLKQNMPTIMALLGIWYSNFYTAQSHAVIPYDDRLKQLPLHLQQLDMESNGKSMTRSGSTADYTTGPIIFGSPGTDCQHAYFESIHQGTHLIPVDFLIALNNTTSSKDRDETLLANCFAQSEAMMCGQSIDEVKAALKASGHNAGEIELLTPHKVIEGNKPSNTLLYDELNPGTLGALLALYEHKVFVQGVIWQINSFDQWGVELGKQLADQIKLDLHQASPSRHDCSTEGLMQKVRSGKL